MTNLTFFGIFAALGTALLSWWAFIKYVVLASYRLEPEASRLILERIMTSARWKYVINNHHVVAPKQPDVFEAYVWLNGTGFLFTLNERLLTAGHSGKEMVSTITYCRWQHRKVLELLASAVVENVVDVRILTNFGPSKLGSIVPDPNAQIFTAPEVFDDIEAEVAAVASGARNKTGMLLYGPPGNGKTQFVKYLAKKYALPIFVVYFDPENTNMDLALLFAKIPKRCILLLEDFDTVFDQRKCLINDTVKFTFDAVINSLDGIHNDYKQVVFALTVNDLTKVDSSLKTRPSRFKFVREFGPPGYEMRKKILGSEVLALETEGLSLDQVFNHEKSPYR